MKQTNDIKKQRLIKEANQLLDILEEQMKFVFESIKAKRNKKAA